MINLIKTNIEQKVLVIEKIISKFSDMYQPCTLRKNRLLVEEENKKDELQNGIEINWRLVKKVIEPLEDLIRKIDTELGGKQYKYLNQMIKISNEIHTALIEKKKS